MSLPAELEHRAMFGRTTREEVFPDVAGLGDLAGPRQPRRREALPVGFAQRLLPHRILAQLADAVNQPVARRDEQEAAELISIGEAPAAFAEAAQQVDPDRLDDVGRIKFGTKPSRQLTADDPAQVRLVLD